MTTETIPTETRVIEQTADHVNRAIRRQLEANIYHYARHPEQIDERLRELDHEWDVERVLETNAGVLTLSAMALGLIFKPLRILPAVVAGFLVQHAVQGWCPPVPVVRRMGVRTTYEIALERYALKALRGDFKGVESEQDPCIKSAKALAAACANGSPFQSDLL